MTKTLLGCSLAATVKLATLSIQDIEIKHRPRGQMTVRVLFDNGSEVTIVRNAFAMKAGFKWQPATLLKPTPTHLGVGFGVWCCKIMRVRPKLLKHLEYPKYAKKKLGIIYTGSLPRGSLMSAQRSST